MWSVQTIYNSNDNSMMTIEEIKAMAREAGACGRIEEVTDMGSACRMLFTPQGREFAVKRGFPTLDMFRGIPASVLSREGIYVDRRGSIVRRYSVAIAGESEVTIDADNTGAVYKVMLFHGAKARVNATNYAVVTVTRVGECECEITDDGTAKIMME